MREEQRGFLRFEPILEAGKCHGEGFLRVLQSKPLASMIKLLQHVQNGRLASPDLPKEREKKCSKIKENSQQ